MKNNSKGFSLILSLIFIVFIGIVFCVSYFGYQYWKIYSVKSFDECIKSPGSMTDANVTANICVTKYNKKFTQPLSNIQKQGLINAQIDAQIRPALELYFSDYKKYPNFLKQLVPKYLVSMPLNPLTNKLYSYEVSIDKSNYTITTILTDGSVYKANAPR